MSKSATLKVGDEVEFLGYSDEVSEEEEILQEGDDYL